MPDLVFVRANQSQPVKEGGAVIVVGPALGSGAIQTARNQGFVMPPSGQASFAQTVLANRFRNYNYYENATGYPPDAAGPTF